MTEPARWWRRRRDQLLAEARRAQAAAAIALVALDSDQRSTFSHLDHLAGVEAGPIARRLRLAWAPVGAQCDAAVAGYLDSLERYDVESDLEVDTAAAAADAFERHRAAMRTASAQVAEFSERFRPDFVNVTRTLEQLTARRRAAEQAYDDAARAVAAAHADGLLAPEAARLLSTAADRLAVVAGGPAAHGMAAVVQACTDAAAAADEARHSADGLPVLRERVRARLSSLQTRTSALEWRARTGSAVAMSALRRGYAEACWRDLDGGDRRAATALDRAAGHLAAARRAASDREQRWEQALREAAAARDALAIAQEHLDGPADRLELLRAVSADPSAAYAAARSAVREARTLLMAGPVDAEHARAQDALAEQLERAGALRSARHPDWLAYARSVDAVRDAAAGLVVDIRAARAR